MGGNLLFCQMARPLAMLALLLMLCLNVAAQVDWQTYKNKQHGFSLRLPEGWIIKEKLEPPAVLLVQSPIEDFDNDYREEMELRWHNSKGGGMDLQRWIGQMRQGHAGFTEVVRGRGRIGANGADWVVFTMDHWGIQVQCIAYLFKLDPHTTYVLLCTSVQEDYERHESLFRQTAESLKFK